MRSKVVHVDCVCVCVFVVILHINLICARCWKLVYVLHFVSCVGATRARVPSAAPSPPPGWRILGRRKTGQSSDQPQLADRKLESSTEQGSALGIDKYDLQLAQPMNANADTHFVPTSTYSAQIGSG